jgi:hypothetical protein
MDALVHLSGLGDLPPKAQAKKWALFEKRWNFQLRRLYRGSDFSHLAPLLLETVENALQSDSDLPQNSGPASDDYLVFG